MDKFEYTARNPEGETKKGLVEAADEKQAARILQERGLLITSLRSKPKNFLNELKETFFGRIKSGDKVNFTRQLSTMITAGLPITEALRILEVQASTAMGRVVGEILREVEGGKSLAESLGRHPAVFDQIYVALVRAGESAGVLDEVLKRLADNLEKQREFKNKIKGAMIYPVIVISGMVLVAAIMIMFVIPKMTSIYEEFQAELPLPTKILLGISSFFTTFWWLALPILVGLVLAFRILSKKPQFKKKYDQILFKIPILGKLRRQMVLTEFARTLGLLVGAGILIVDAIEIVCHSLGSVTYEQAVTSAGQEVERGLPLAAALARTEVFPPILPQMISVGEETGKLDEVLGKVSSYFEQEADIAVKGLTTAIEPIIMIILGVGVGFLVIAVIMPIYNLTSQF